MYEAKCTPAYIALIDSTGGPTYLELVKSALLAALEAMPPAALFGLVTFSNEVHTHCALHPSILAVLQGLYMHMHIGLSKVLLACSGLLQDCIPLLCMQLMQ